MRKLVPSFLTNYSHFQKYRIVLLSVDTLCEAKKKFKYSHLLNQVIILNYVLLNCKVSQ